MFESNEFAYTFENLLFYLLKHKRSLEKHFQSVFDFLTSVQASFEI